MVETAGRLFSDLEKTSTVGDQRRTGLLPSHVIRELVRGREIWAPVPVEENQIQPASIDLRLGDVAYRVRASFLPGKSCSVMDKIRAHSLHELDLRRGAVLEKECVYIVPLMESLRLGPRISARANPKSSTGRIDVFLRVITDGGTEFDEVPAGYEGPLYAEIAPRTFSILVRAGSRLGQLRLRRGSPASSDRDMQRLHAEVGLVSRPIEEREIERGVPVTVDLAGEPTAGLIGYRARRHTRLIDVDAVGAHEPLDFWEPIFANRDRNLILDPGNFYILASKEGLRIPPTHAAEMVAYDTLVGEFRVHYAGFFDPGFGWGEEAEGGTRAVLEVRSHEVPFIIEDGQLVGRLIYEKLTDVPSKVYGGRIGSSYQRQGLTLSKHFRPLVLPAGP